MRGGAGTGRPGGGSRCRAQRGGGGHRLGCGRGAFRAHGPRAGRASDLLERHAAHLPRAAIVRAVHPAKAGRVHAVDARALGLAVVELGGGRRHAGHPVDHAVGLTQVHGIGEEVGAEIPLALVHGRDEAAVAAAGKRLRDAYMVGAGASEAPPVIYKRIG